MFLAVQKKRLIETVLLSTHNICVWLKNKNNNFPLLTLLEAWAVFSITVDSR